jgi:hypothetical protein
MERTEYIGEDSYLFYDIETGCLYKHNGLPGGEPICGGGPGGGGGVESYPTIGDFPTTGIEDVIYIAEDTNLLYRWDGAAYVLVGGAGPGGTDNVDTYADLGSFPVTGAADVIYIADDTNIIYRWDGISYVPLTAAAGTKDVYEYADLASFPGTGQADVLYIAADTNILYRWDGSTYVPVGGDNHEYATVTIPASSTATLYSVLPAGNLSLKFILSIVDTVDGRFATSEVLGSYKLLDNSVSHNRYSVLGDKIKYQPDLVYAGPAVQLNIVNNDVNPIKVKLVRVPTQPLT